VSALTVGAHVCADSNRWCGTVRGLCQLLPVAHTYVLTQIVSCRRGSAARGLCQRLPVAHTFVLTQIAGCGTVRGLCQRLPVAHTFVPTQIVDCSPGRVGSGGTVGEGDHRHVDHHCESTVIGAVVLSTHSFQ